jgi:hypothetical protein
MEGGLLRIPVVCPECGNEPLIELPAPFLAEALVVGDSIRLHASCHGKVWSASGIEREQLRSYLEAANMTRLARKSTQQC